MTDPSTLQIEIVPGDGSASDAFATPVATDAENNKVSPGGTRRGSFASNGRKNSLKFWSPKNKQDTLENIQTHIADDPYGEPERVPIDEIQQHLQSLDIEKGLTTAFAEKRLEEEGLNELTQEPPPSLLMLFVEQLTSIIMMLLIASTIICFVIGGIENDTGQFINGTAIGVIVLLNAGIAAWTENVANSALEALKKMSQATCTVVRDGQEVQLESAKVVRGDIVLLQTGDVVPADVRLITANELKVNEMLLTGEPEDVLKSDKIKEAATEAKKLTPVTMAFSTTTVANGNARCIVTATGMHTRIGAIARMLKGEEAKDPDPEPKHAHEHEKEHKKPKGKPNETPLQTNLNKLSITIGYLAIFVCFLVWVIGWGLGRQDDDEKQASWLFMLLVAVTLAVAAIPEGLPLCVTISLSMGCNKMVKRDVLVRKLAAVETLGSASVICTDKTGTLTEGKMTMVKMFTGLREYEIIGKGFNPTLGKVVRRLKDGEDPDPDPIQVIAAFQDSISFPKRTISFQERMEDPNVTDANHELTVQTTLCAGLLNCTATISKNEETGMWEPKGNSSEAPIVVAAGKVGYTSEETHKKFPKVVEVPFNSERKLMMTIHETGGNDRFGVRAQKFPEGTKYIAIIKGASNIVLGHCKSYLKQTGDVVAADQAFHEEVTDKIDDLSSQALRVLCIAVRFHKEMPFDLKDENLDTVGKLDAVLAPPGGDVAGTNGKSAAGDEHFPDCIQYCGLVASIDPARDGVAESVVAASEGGLRVVMITGDYVKTAIAIAEDIGILYKEQIRV